jgi:hypothetical protein
MPRDVDAARDPDAGMARHMVEQALQADRATGMADDAIVQADRQQLRLRPTFFVQHVEGVAAVGEEIVGGGEAAAAEFHVVGRQRVGHHEVRTSMLACPIRQLVVIGVGVIEEPAFLDQQAPRVEARPVTTIPAQRTFAGGRGDRGDGLGDLCALVGLG